MQQFEDTNRRFGHGLKGNSIENGRSTLTGLSRQQWLDEIGGEPLVGSGFESEEPESGFSHASEGR
jgi:hypothetical protein